MDVLLLTISSISMLLSMRNIIVQTAHGRTLEFIRAINATDPKKARAMLDFYQKCSYSAHIFDLTKWSTKQFFPFMRGWI